MYIIIFVMGLILGSFYLVLATRLPKKEDILTSRSRCDNCHKTLKWYHLIPIFSYVFLRGKCAYCHKRISILNPLVELITGSLFILMYFKYGISYEFFAGIIISSLLIIIYISDFKYYIILDSPLIVSGILILILKLCYFGPLSALKALISGIILFSVMFLIGKLGDKVFKRESLGGGDIKLTFIIGLCLGLRLGLVALMLSAFLALPISLASFMKTKNNELPFGPFLIGSLFLIFIFMTKFTNLINLVFNL